MDEEASASLCSSEEQEEDGLCWNAISDLVGCILERRRPSGTSTCGGEATHGKRLRREDSQVLLRGFDSIASSLSQLTGTLTAAQKCIAGDLGKSSMATMVESTKKRIEEEEEEEEEARETKRRKAPPPAATKGDEQVTTGGEAVAADGPTSFNLRMTKLAANMAAKAASMARQMKAMSSELRLMQERCVHLHEENRRLRGAAEKGERAEEDDLVRLQLEALLAEKSRLANENASLTRENQCLQQMVEYHQLASSSPPLETCEEEEEMAASQGVCLDFETPGPTERKMDCLNDGASPAGGDCWWSAGFSEFPAGDDAEDDSSGLEAAAGAAPLLV